MFVQDRVANKLSSDGFPSDFGQTCTEASAELMQRARECTTRTPL